MFMDFDADMLSKSWQKIIRCEHEDIQHRDSKMAILVGKIYFVSP
jgi:hypothetical protein